MDYPFYISQLIAILSAIYFAKHDAPACNKFADAGAWSDELATFHRNGGKLRAVIVTGLSLMLLFPLGVSDINNALLAGGINAAWVFLLFDIVLNKARKRGLSWDYIGGHDDTGRWLKKRLGRNAGQWKALICLVVVIGLNIVKILL